MTNLELNYLNLGNMNFATLVLPADDSEINEFFAKLNPMDTDVELQWVEFPEDVTVKAKYNDMSLSQLKEIAELDDIEEFDKVLYACDNDVAYAIEKYEAGEFSIIDDCKNDTDLGYHVADVTDLFHGADENSVLVRYFDYEAFGRDCRLEGSYTQYDYDTMVEIY